MNNIETSIDELEKMSKYANVLKNPDEFFRHMKGHQTELSLVLSAFSIVEYKDDINIALEKQIPKKPKETISGCIEVTGVCPSCSAIHFLTQKYCYNCGQRLDWGD